jgi:hypothetical protein
MFGRLAEQVNPNYRHHQPSLACSRTRKGEDHARSIRPHHTSLLFSLCSGTDCMGNSIAGEPFRLIVSCGHRAADFTDIAILVAFYSGPNLGRGGAQ